MIMNQDSLKLQRVSPLHARQNVTANGQPLLGHHVRKLMPVWHDEALS